MLAMRPRAFKILAVLTILVGGLGMGHAGGQQLLRYLQPHDRFVESYRDAVAQSVDTAKLAAGEHDRVASELGERAWSRRGVNLPLGIVNFILSFLLFAGALEALRGQAWGHSAWEWAARLSILYTLVAMVLHLVEAGDMAVFLEARAHLVPEMSKESLAQAGVGFYRLAAVLVSAALVAFYAGTARYLRRPAIRALFDPPAPPEEPPPPAAPPAA